MLTATAERGRPKCHHYWPNLYESAEYGSLQVTCLREKEVVGCVFREFKITSQEVQRYRGRDRHTDRLTAACVAEQQSVKTKAAGCATHCQHSTDRLALRPERAVLRYCCSLKKKGECHRCSTLRGQITACQRIISSSSTSSSKCASVALASSQFSYTAGRHEMLLLT